MEITTKSMTVKGYKKKHKFEIETASDKNLAISEPTVLYGTGIAAIEIMPVPSDAGRQHSVFRLQNARRIRRKVWEVMEAVNLRLHFR